MKREKQAMGSTQESGRRKGIVFMVMCAALWSIAGIFIKLIPWHPLVIAGFRSLISAGVFAVYMKARKLSFRINRASILSGVSLTLTFFAFVTANKLTTSANAIVLQFVAPVFILLISAVLYHQRFSRADVITVFLTLAGISLFFFDQLSGGYLAGNLIAIFAGFTMAWMYVLTGRADDESRMSGILIGHLITAVVGIPFVFVFETPVSFGAMASILVLGVVQLGIPYVLYGIAVKTCPPLACSLIGAVEPLLNPLWVFLFDGERPGVFALIGGVIVIGTITLWCAMGRTETGVPAGTETESC